MDREFLPHLSPASSIPAWRRPSRHRRGRSFIRQRSTPTSRIGRRARDHCARGTRVREPSPLHVRLLRRRGVRSRRDLRRDGADVRAAGRVMDKVLDALQEHLLAHEPVILATVGELRGEEDLGSSGRTTCDRGPWHRARLDHIARTVPSRTPATAAAMRGTEPLPSAGSSQMIVRNRV